MGPMRRLTALLVALAPLSAGAETLQGRLTFGATGDDGGVSPYVSADLDLPLGTPRIGVRFGVYGLFATGDSSHETYATAEIGLGPGTLSAGVPRPAYDRFAVSALDRLAPRLGVPATATTRSRLTTGAMFLSETPLGLAWTGKDWAASVGEVDGTTALSLGGRARLGDWAVEGAVEAVEGAGDGLSAKLSAARRIGDWTAGATAFLPGTLTSGAAVEATVSTLRGGLTVTGVALVAADESRLAVVAERKVAKHGTLRAGLGRGPDGAAADLALDLRF